VNRAQSAANECGRNRLLARRDVKGPSFRSLHNRFMSSSTDSSRIVRVRGANFVQWIALVPTLAVLGFGLYVVIFVFTSRPAYYVVYGLALGGSSIAFALAMMAWTLGGLRGVVADQAEVRIARGWRWHTIPVADVSGVGLLFQYSPGGGRARAPSTR
jgi:hypothetical protein